MQKPKKRSLNDEVDRLVLIMGNVSPDTDEYEKMVKNLEVLCKARTNKSPNMPSMDTIVTAVSSILSVILILNYEHMHVVTSKALSFILKVKV